MKKIIHSILVITLALGHWSFASADPRPSDLPEDIQLRLDSVLSENLQTDQTREQLYQTMIIKGPSQDNSAVVSRSLSAQEGLLMFQAYEAERIASEIPNENFFEQITDNESIRSMSPIVDLEKHPNFFRNAEARFEELKVEHEKRKADKAILMKADASMEVESEKQKNIVNLFIRSGTTVFFFAVLTDPSTLGLASISIISLIGTFLYLQMTKVEKAYKAGGRAAQAVDQVVGKAVYKMADYVNVSNETKEWAADFYRTKIRANGYLDIVGQLGVAFGISLILTSAYAIAMNLGAIGLDQAAAASGKFFAWDRSFDHVPFRFFDGFSASQFFSAFNSEFTKLSISKAWAVLVHEPVIVKAVLLTAFAETWTIYRSKYRGMTHDQTKANQLGRLAGVFFAFMGPFVHKSTSVLLGQSSNPLDIAGLFLVGLVGATGLAYIFGDAKAYNEGLQRMAAGAKLRTEILVNSVKQSPKNLYHAASNAYQKTKKMARSTLAASMFGMMELTHALDNLQNPSRPNTVEVPALVENGFSRKSGPISCKLSF